MRVISHTLAESGVYMGETNESYDKLPPDAIHEAAGLFGRQVAQLGPYRWDFSGVKAPTPDVRRLIHFHALDVLEQPLSGWKLAETALIFPWIAEMYPKAYFIHWTRDPRDMLRQPHITDYLPLWNVPSMAKTRVDERIESWVYHQEIVRATPRPANMLDVTFEDFITDQEGCLKRLEAFLGFPLARIEVDPSTVGHSDPFPVHHELLERYGY
jgi:hypothetical protein